MNLPDRNFRCFRPVLHVGNRQLQRSFRRDRDGAHVHTSYSPAPMRFLKFLVLVIALVASARPADAQLSQDSTLKGLRQVYLDVVTNEGALDEAIVASMESSIALELRKAGIRVAPRLEDIDAAKDGVMIVHFYRIPRSLSNDAIFRIDLRQAVRLDRNPTQPVFVTTWFHEDNGRNVVPNDFSTAASRKGVDAFLTKWLDMNGR
jgi:hypothetical protein